MTDNAQGDGETGMKSMWQEATRRELQDRLATLAPESGRRWGRMTAPEMVAHVSESFKSCLGGLDVKPVKLPIRFPPLKQLIIYWLPFPKNSPTAPELLARKPASWSSDVAELRGLMDRFVTHDPAEAWPDHAAFGRMNGTRWGVLMYRHTDHHFRQFGV